LAILTFAHAIELDRGDGMPAGRRFLHCALLLGCASRLQAQQVGGRLHGVRFAVDTLETPLAWRGELSRLSGIVEYARSRGRFSVTAVRGGPPVALNGVILGAPLARPGDYYLFDSTGFVLVRPASRTFSSFVFTRAEYNQSGGFLPGQFLMKNTPWHTDTLSLGEARRLRQHAPASIHWHLDSLDARGPKQIYARGWIELRDAPASEAGVTRWFGVASALASRPGGIRALPRDRLQLTAVALLRRSSDRDDYLRYLGMLTPLGLMEADVDPGRLVLPAGYTGKRWPGFERDAGLEEPSLAVASHWRSLDEVGTTQ
jgi:hypothetical protein